LSIPELKKTTEKMQKMAETVSKQEYERAMETLRKEKLKAVKDGDTDKYVELEKQEAKMEKPEPVVETQRVAPGAMPDFVQDWMNDNSKWYNVNPTATAYATALEPQLAKSTGLQGKDLLDKITEEVQTRFPELFENKNRTAPPAVDDGGNVPGSAPVKKKSYSALPNEAKTQCDKMCKSIPGFTREKYVANYAWD